MRTKVVYDKNNPSYVILVKKFFFSPWRILCVRNKHNSPVRYSTYDAASWSARFITRRYLKIQRNHYCLQPLIK